MYTLAKVEDASLRVDYEVQELTGIKTTSLTAKTLTAGDNTLQTTTDTVYYLVVKTVKGLEITTWDRLCQWAPKSAALVAGSTYGYAVTHDGEGKYDVADIVVFETASSNDSALYFVYRDKAANDTEVYVIGYDSRHRELHRHPRRCGARHCSERH